MIEVNKTLNEDEKDILRSLVGSTILTLEAALAAPPEIAWNTVRVHADSGSIDVSCLLESMPVGLEGDEDEHGIVSIARASAERLEVPGISADTSSYEVNKLVTGTGVVNDRMEVYENGELGYRSVTTKAIALFTEAGTLVFDRQAWFDETLAIGWGEDPKKLVFDEWAGWEDDEEEEPGIHYDTSWELVRL